MFRLILLIALLAFLWALAVILIGYELPFGSLLLGISAAYASPKYSSRLSLFVSSLVYILGIILYYFLSFSFFTAPTLDGIFSFYNLDFFFHSYLYLPNFWTVWDFIWAGLGLGLCWFIILWRRR